MALLAALPFLADIGLSLASGFFPESDVPGFPSISSPVSPATRELPSVTQTTTTDVRVGGPTVSQVVSLGGRAVPVVAPSTVFQPMQSPQVLPAFFDEVTRFEGPTTVQNIPWVLFLGAALAAFAFGKLT